MLHCFAEQSGSSSTSYTESGIMIHGFRSKRIKNTCQHKNLYKNVHSSIIHNCPKLKQSKCPSTAEHINWNSTDTCYRIEEPQNIMLNDRRQMQKISCCMIPLIGKVQKTLICREIKQISDCLGVREDFANSFKEIWK